MRQRPFVLSTDPHAPFPPADSAMRDPDGLVAIGGDLSQPRLLNAYRHGIFPWFSAGQPPLWWSPDPRMVFCTNSVRLSSRFRRELKRSTWSVQADTCFEQVITACAQSPRPGQHGTWITSGMRQAYVDLHRQGHAHSVEVFDGDHLVGGIYGVAIGRMFFGESMFSHRSGGSKVALAALAARLCEWGWPLIDAQVENDHLHSLGGCLMPRETFLEQIDRLVDQPSPDGAWTHLFGVLAAASLSQASVP